MTITKFVRFFLMIGIGATVSVQVTGTSGAQTPQQATLVLKVGATGPVSVDGKVSANGEAGQVLTLNLQPGQHLVSLKTPDGKTIEKLVTLEAGHSTVVVLDAPQSGLTKTRAPTSGQGDPSSQGTQAKPQTTPVSSGSHSLARPSSLSQADQEREKLRVIALEVLALDGAALDEARRFNIQPPPSLLDSIASLKKNVQDEKDKGKEIPKAWLVTLGQNDQALSGAEKYIHESDAVAPDFVVTSDMRERARLLFAGGEQKQAIAELNEVPGFISFLKSHRNDGAFFSPDEAAYASLLSLTSEYLAAMRALTNDWDGCVRAVTQVSQSELEQVPGLRDLAQGCKSIASKHPGLGHPVATGQDARPLITNMFKENLQLVALTQLGLWADVLEGERRGNKHPSQIQLLENAVANSKRGQDYLGLGQPQHALMNADQAIDQSEHSIRLEEDAKGKCPACLGRTGADDHLLAVDRLEKAIALFATGNQQQGIAEVSEAQSSFSLARSEGYVQGKGIDQVAESFLDLAAMYAIMGNGDGCFRALRELADDDIYGPKLRGRSLWQGCSWLVYAGSMDSGSSTAGMQTASSVRDQINEVVRSGRYSSLPEPEITNSSIGNGPPSVSIKNDTRYNLTVLCSGPTERSIEVAPGQTSLVELTAGSYQVLGRVDAPNVLPMYKKYEFQSGPTYSFDFYISSR